MCFASGGGGSASNSMYRTRGPLTPTEEEQRRSQSAAWASRDRGGAMDPYKLMPSSRQAKIPFRNAEVMNRAGVPVFRRDPEMAEQRWENQQRFNLGLPVEKPKMKLGIRRG